MRGDKGGDYLREAPNMGLWLENLVSFVICPLWEVLPYDADFNSICISNFETSFGQKRGYCTGVNMVKKIQIQLINYKKTIRGCQHIELTVL